MSADTSSDGQGELSDEQADQILDRLMERAEARDDVDLDRDERGSLSMTRRQALLGAGGLLGIGALSANSMTAQAATGNWTNASGSAGTQNNPLTDVWGQNGHYQTIDSEQATIGDSTVGANADVAIYLDGTEAVAVDPAGEIARSTSHGSVWQSAIDSMADNETLQVAPGSYSTSDTDPISTKLNRNLHINAYGALINSTLLVRQTDQSIRGLRVDGAAGHGFDFYYGTGGHFQDLTAANCGSAGYRLGGAQDRQVANATFITCYSAANTGQGWILDGSFLNNWVNANTFTGCLARDNGGIGWDLSAGGAIEYNTFVGCEAENNVTYSVHVGSGIAANTWTGGHMTTQARFDSSKNYVVGGRWANGFDLTNGETPFNLMVSAPNPNDYGYTILAPKDLTTISGGFGGEVAVDNGTNTTSGNNELAVWDTSLNAGAGGWYTMGGDVI